MRKSTIFLIMIMLVAVSCSKKEVSQKAENILEAKVTLVKGVAYIFKAETPEKIVVNIGTIVMPGDVLVTGSGSSVVVAIKNRGIMKIGENSEVAFKELLVIDEENNSAVVNLTRGKIISGVKKLIKTSKFNVETPTAVVGVRGTSFMVAVQKEEDSAFPYFVKVPKKSNVITKVGVLTGKVELQNIKEPHTKISIDNMKEATIVNDDFKNIKIVKISPLTIEEIKEIKDAPVVEELKIDEIKEELNLTETESVIKEEVKVKSAVKTKQEVEEAAEESKEELKKDATGNLKKQQKKSGKYLEDETSGW